MQNPQIDGNAIRLRPNAVGEFKEEERFCTNCSANLACSLYGRMSDDLPEGSVRQAVASNVLGEDTNIKEKKTKLGFRKKNASLMCYDGGQNDEFAFVVRPIRRAFDRKGTAIRLALADAVGH